MEALFSLGQILATPGALDALTRAEQAHGDFLCRHAAGDFRLWVRQKGTPSALRSTLRPQAGPIALGARESRRCEPVAEQTSESPSSGQNKDGRRSYLPVIHRPAKCLCILLLLSSGPLAAAILQHVPNNTCNIGVTNC